MSRRLRTQWSRPGSALAVQAADARAEPHADHPEGRLLRQNETRGGRCRGSATAPR